MPPRPRKSTAAPRNARQAAATGGRIPVEFDGSTYTLLAADDWPIDLLESIEDEQMRPTRLARQILGDDQWQQFKERHKTSGELNRFFTAMGDALGTGNPTDSAGSSSSTATR